MYPGYTRDQFTALQEVPTTLDPEGVFTSLQTKTSAPLFWNAPGDDAEFITELEIGAFADPRKTTITFSQHANLCYVDSPSDPLIERSVVEAVLDEHGWITVPPDAAKIILYPPNETVFHRFFFYI